MDKEQRNQIVFLIMYLVIYFAAMILITQPWRVRIFLKRAQQEIDELRGIVPLDGVQEMAVREFRQRVSEWDHAEQFRTRNRTEKGHQS